MDFTLEDILHTIGQALMNPCLVVLFLLMAVAVWQVGDLLVELLVERRKYRVKVPELMQALHAGGKEHLAKQIEASGLLRGQKDILLSMIQADNLPKESLVALAQSQLATAERRCEKTVAVTNLVATLGPRFGLLGTLIPLGPGIVALGQGDTTTLSSSLAVAFDTTIAGLISAAVASVISNIRNRWYHDDMVILETLMEATLQEVIEDAE